MREVHVSEIVEKVKNMVMDAEYNLPEDFVKSLETAKAFEESPVGRRNN
ncbi:MAG: hypothetical protein Q9M89_00475 [Persephonella sp.]|nr:hypothetical protein [Persephonella sp.]